MYIKIFEIVKKKHGGKYKVNNAKSIDKDICFSRKEKNLNFHQISISFRRSGNPDLSR